MPRTARIKSTTGTYHIMLLAAKKRGIFRSEPDYEEFMRIVSYVQTHMHSEPQSEPTFELCAYSLQPGHVHMLIREGREPVANITRRIMVQYVQYYNDRYNTYGRVFFDRYMSEPCDTEATFQAVADYIRLNPVKHRLATSPDDYPWMSSPSLVTGLDAMPDIDLTEDRRPHMTDYQVRKRLLHLTRTTSIDEFLTQPKRIQRSALAMMRQKEVSLGQLVRVSGCTINVVRKARVLVKLPIRIKKSEA